MSVSSVFFTNDSVLQSISSINTKYPLDILCFISGPSCSMVTAYFITYILVLLPLCISILHHGFHQWQQNHSTSSGAKMSHSDCFTYHLVGIQLICILAYFSCCVGTYSNTYLLFLTGFYLFSFVWFGEVCFHVLTCVERYLAAVHPITYLNLRNDRGVRMRNLAVGCVWMICVVWTVLMMQDFYNILNFCFLIISFITVCLCSLSVLCVLIHPGPGDQEGGIRRVSQSKLRAFYTITSILLVLMVRFSWCFAWAILYQSKKSLNCLLMTADLWFNLPCAVTLPLLYLHRKGKLMCCKKRDQ